jgi:hypothetical protein
VCQHGAAPHVLRRPKIGTVSALVGRNMDKTMSHSVSVRTAAP